MEGTCSEKLKQILNKVTRDTIRCTTNTFDLAIGCKMDSLQDAAEIIYNRPSEYMTMVSALNYLATYPNTKHLKIFREIILETTFENETLLKRIAAKGLAELQDTSSISAIIKASEKERKGSDWNTSMYLKALGKLKGEVAKSYVSTFLESKEERMKVLAKEMIDNW